MNTKAFVLMIAAGLATGPGAVKAQQLDALDPVIDLPSIAEIIVDELLGGEDTPFVLAIGLSLGFSFASDNITLADTVSEGLVASNGAGAGVVDVFADSLATPGLAATSTGVDTVVINLTPLAGLVQTSVSPD
jgi:hypothetical protein